VNLPWLIFIFKINKLKFITTEYRWSPSVEFILLRLQLIHKKVHPGDQLKLI